LGGNPIILGKYESFIFFSFLFGVLVFVGVIPHLVFGFGGGGGCEGTLRV